MIAPIPNPRRFADAALALFVALLFFGGLRSAPAAENLTPLSKSPDWASLEKYQETITRDDFERLLRNVYCTRGVDETLIKVEEEAACILQDKDEQTWFELRFAGEVSAAKPVAHAWRPASALPSARSCHELDGIKIALDPGHIGGTWAQMEERWFQVGDSRPVQEGDMTLLVAQILKPQLEKLGAHVSLVRDKLEPVTSKRPHDLEEVSRKILLREGHAQPRADFTGPDDPEKEQTIRWQNEILFYRNSEIRERAELVNSTLHPDLVLCLHFNAEAWNDPRHPT
ncbi:MAG: hypothetical protein ABI883_02720, partial [Chthoniobacterales bacterium]